MQILNLVYGKLYYFERVNVNCAAFSCIYTFRSDVLYAASRFSIRLVYQKSGGTLLEVC